MKSVIQSEKECYVCKSKHGLQCHHIFFGTANRKQSEKYGLKVWLCRDHHTGNVGVHFNKEFDTYVKKLAQVHFEKTHGSREDFRKIFGKSFL